MYTEEGIINQEEIKICDYFEDKPPHKKCGKSPHCFDCNLLPSYLADDMGASKLIRTKQIEDKLLS